MDVFAHLYFDHYECINIISYNAIKSISYSIWCCGITTPPDPCKQSLTACVIPSDFLFTIRNTREISAIQVWSHAPPLKVTASTRIFCWFFAWLATLHGMVWVARPFMTHIWLWCDLAEVRSSKWATPGFTDLHGFMRKLCKFTSWLVKALGLVAIRKYSKQKSGHRSRSLRHWWYFIIISIWWQRILNKKCRQL